MYRFLFLILVVFTGSLASAQSMKKANKMQKRGEYQLAIAKYQHYLNNPKLKAESNFQIAEAYRLSNRLKQAKPYYEAAIINGYKGPEPYYYLSYALKEIGDYAGAEKELNKFLRVADDPEMIEKANMELDNLAQLVIISETKNYYRVKNLKNINTSSAEYCPVYKNGNLYFTSNRQGGKTYKATGTGFTDLYSVRTKGARVDTSSIKALDQVINTSNANEGTIAFSPDGKTIVFARGNTGKRKGTADVNLLISRYRNKSWSTPRILSISKADSWDSSPAFSRDGRTLYFSSNRKDPNAQGGLDLYSARLDPRGRFAKVKNLGPEVNTPGDEMFPYVANDGTLYFSSTGHAGFGGLDIFKARRKAGHITVTNLGKPMNSSSDDFGIFLFKVDRGFFTSNRPEGKGDDDIWTFVNDDPNLKTVNYFLEGITKTHDEKDNTDVLDDVKVLLLDYQNNVLDETVTGKDGQFNFRVYENENYVLLAEKEGADAADYYVTRMEFSTIGKAVPQEELKDLITNITYDTLMFLDKIVLNKAIVLENIYYDFAKWNIRPDAAQELDKLVALLKDNPDITIELSSHTDSVDTEAYNQRLSQRRAESAVNYIVSAGIDRSRITAKGYGESRPIAPNTNPDGTDNPEGRQKNRRTEFKVTSYNKSEHKNDLNKNKPNQQEFEEDKYFKNVKDDGNNNL